MPIYKFRGEYWFLANPYSCTVELGDDKLVYPSAEHALAANKTTDLEIRTVIAATPDWRKAKTIGRQLALRPGWDDYRKQIMLDIVLAKFTQHADLAAKLIATGDDLLVEGNTWGDDYWGMVLRDGAWEGHNYLGKILMSVRMVLEP